MCESRPEPPPLNPQLRNQLQRFLHLGNEIPKYYPGCWSSHKYYEVDRLQAVNEALANGEASEEVVNIILQAYKDGFYTRFETIAFALAKCLLLGSVPIKEAVYKAAAEISNSPEELMTFNKFTRDLKTGNGRGWCNYVQKWYYKKAPMELAKEMSRVHSRFGRSHKTLLRKSHVKIPDSDHARDALVKYALFGLKRAKLLMGNKDGTKEIFDYVQKVEDVRHCEDPAVAAEMAAEYQFTLDHVPAHLLTSQDVWNAILPQMSLEELLHNIQRLHNMGFLTSDSTSTSIVVSLLNNQEVIQKSKVTPLAVYLTLNNYMKKTKPMKHEKAKIIGEKEKRRRTRQTFDSETGIWQWATTKRHQKEIKHWGIDHPPNIEVVQALSKLVDLTWVLTPPTNVRYMITLDMRQHMFRGRHFCKPKKTMNATNAASADAGTVKKSKKHLLAEWFYNNNITPSGHTGRRFCKPKKTRKTTVPATAAASVDAEMEKNSKKRLLAECFYNKNITPGHAAIILALQLLKREKNVKIAVFTEDGVQLVFIERNFSSIEEAEFVLRNANLGRVQMDAPIEWAANNKHKVDVFINMVDRVSRCSELDVSDRGGRGPGGRFGPPPESEELADHCPVRALERYRQSAGVQDAKLIVMNLATHQVMTTDGTYEGVLDMVGIDEYVPKVMDAFALGKFK